MRGRAGKLSASDPALGARWPVCNQKQLQQADRRALRLSELRDITRTEVCPFLATTKPRSGWLWDITDVPGRGPEGLASP